ncbi:cytochrome b/b6 domain-containing protein [Pontibacter sp. JAM-7]|uniref:cytochrome b/b6 domain-containing protein n=1 Tax=Pontibacter sp. JAM-7 TaxID=3366581 RepID=UPI003AF8D237
MQSQQRIWDPLIRLFHWSVAAGFLLNFTLTEEGETLHEWIGYYILAALLVRVCWGFIGPRNARFSDFFPRKPGLKSHLRELAQGQIKQHAGHTPLGGLMVMLLMAGLLLVGLSGWLTTTDMFWGEDWVEDVHEFFANLTLLLVLVHVAAVTLFSVLGPANLVRQMLTGRRCTRKLNKN